MTRYEVQVRKYGKRNYKTVKVFINSIETGFTGEDESHKYAVKLDMEYRKSIDTMFDNIRIKTIFENGRWETFQIA